MRKYKGILASVLAACLAVCAAGTVSADKQGYEIDPEGMKELERASSFEVQVTEKKVVEECLDTDAMDHNDDVLILTVANSADQPVKAVTVKYVAYNEDNITVNPAPSHVLTMSIGDEAHEIFSLHSPDDALIEAGGTYELMQAVNFSHFSGIRAMVTEYALEDGTVVSNPDYPTWENMAFGLSAGNVTELD